jgi:predicted RNA methylase
MCKKNKDYIFLKKAYDLKKTVKSTHNFSNYLFYQKNNNKKALKVQKECIELNPKSHYPYLLY